MGNENRDQILPSKSIDEEESKIPKYDFGVGVRTPRSIGVRRDDTFGSVRDAMRGMMFYSDLIGFGQSTSPRTAGMPLTPIGINFFMPSGLTCSNGADMWTYFQGIPTGNALGPRVNNAMAEMGLPRMRGLAPGIIEDAQEALNPRPMLQAAFGNVYPKCVQATLQVGDATGRTQDPEDGSKWYVGSPNSIQYYGGWPHQTRWIQERDGKGNPVYVSRKVFNDTPKTQNPDGSRKEIGGFEDVNKASIVVAIVLFATAFAITCKK